MPEAFKEKYPSTRLHSRMKDLLKPPKVEIGLYFSPCSTCLEENDWVKITNVSIADKGNLG
ncbi:unnamed protein product [Pocillopora meandrina]|uniref:Uncharacterized protein n=1 Tax=Pocillopora meandrina TaxID=46732 RepID=A0AAU9W009_9CNID|nr:unnamed protein product [Pocillopora meandrina]